MPDGIVELKPPDGSGFGGHALINAEDDVLIGELIRRGYTRVDRGGQ